MNVWRVAAASEAGGQHDAAATPCEDRTAYRYVRTAREGWLLAVACDGAGSVPFGGLGAALATRAFLRLAAAMARRGEATAFDRDDAGRLIGAARAAVADHAQRNGRVIRHYATTLLGVIAGEHRAVYMQIGDGAIVINDGGRWRPVFWPDQGDHISETTFLTSGTLTKRLGFAADNTPQALALFTDGLERLCLHAATRTAHEPFFDRMVLPVRRSATIGLDRKLSVALGRYLRSPRIRERTYDDCSLIIATREGGRDGPTAERPS